MFNRHHDGPTSWNSRYGILYKTKGSAVGSGSFSVSATKTSQSSVRRSIALTTSETRYSAGQSALDAADPLGNITIVATIRFLTHKSRSS